MKIWEDLFYIVIHKDLSKIRVISKAFDTIYEAKRGFKTLKCNRNENSIMRGEKLLEYELGGSKIYRAKVKFNKYDYPLDRVTIFRRQVYRTVQRRKRKRRIKYAQFRRDNLTGI